MTMRHDDVKGSQKYPPQSRDADRPEMDLGTEEEPTITEQFIPLAVRSGPLGGDGVALAGEYSDGRADTATEVAPSPLGYRGRTPQLPLSAPESLNGDRPSLDVGAGQGVGAEAASAAPQAIAVRTTAGIQAAEAQTAPLKMTRSISPARRSPSPPTMFGDEDDATLIPGAKAGRYEIKECLGRGGMGIVYRAYDPELDRPVALKLLYVGSGDAGDVERNTARSRLLSEAQALARLSHPNVITVFDVGNLDKYVFVAMELVEGHTLKQWLDEGTRTCWQVLDAFIAAGRGLAAAHEVGLIHRDFKPDNVMIGIDGRVRVLDFGLARTGALVDAPKNEGDGEGGGASDGGGDDKGDSKGEAKNHPKNYHDMKDGSDSSGLELLSGLMSKRKTRIQSQSRRRNLALTSLTDTSELDGPNTNSARLLVSSSPAYGASAATVAYIAPEQHSGLPVDARADQFSFCAALYEALYSVRPFSGDAEADVRQDVVDGKVTPPPSEIRVPHWLRNLLLRGLAYDADNRFTSMDELLDSLINGIERRKRLRRGLSVGVAMTLMVGAIGAMVFWAANAQESENERCRSGVGQIDELWSEKNKQALREQFIASRRPYGEQTFQRLDAMVTDYGREWADMRISACEATHVHGEQSEQMLDLRMSCLDNRLGALRGLVRALEKDTASAAAGTVVDRALDAARRLPGIEACSDETRLLEAFPLPHDPEKEAEIVAIGEQIEECEARLETGQSHAISGAALEVVASADELKFPPVQARAYFLLGRVQEQLGELKSAESSLHTAARLAAQARDDRLAAEVWIELMWLLGSRMGKYDEAFALGSLAEIAILRAGGGDDLHAELRARIGTLLGRAGKYEEAERDLNRAINLAEKHWGPSHPVVSRYTGHLALLYLARGDYTMARTFHEELLKLTEETCGTDHVFSIEPLLDLGRIALDQGHFEESADYLRRALAIARANLGESAIESATPLMYLGLLDLARYRFPDAETSLNEAYTLLSQGYGEEHERTADVLVARTRLRLLQQRLGEAEDDLARALTIYGKVLGQRSSRYGQALALRAAVLRAQGDLPAAIDVGRRALSIMEDSVAADHVALAPVLHELGQTLVARKLYEEAETHLQRALALRQEALGVDAPQVAETLLALGQLMVNTGNDRLAAEHLQRAIAIGVGHGYPGVVLAGPRFTLAQALWDIGPNNRRRASGDRAVGAIVGESVRELAVELAIKARNAIAAASESTDDGLKELLKADIGIPDISAVNAWLEDRRRLVQR